MEATGKQDLETRGEGGHGGVPFLSVLPTAQGANSPLSTPLNPAPQESLMVATR